MHSIIIATDHSPNALRAAHRGVLLARAIRADSVELLHVLPAGSRVRRWARGERWQSADPEAAVARMDAARNLAQAMTDIPVKADIVRGPLVDAMVTAARRSDVLVVGASSRIGWLGPMADSTLQLIRRIRVPVLVVRAPPARSYGRVVIPVDLATNPDRALAAARMVAPGAGLHVVHAYRAAYEAKLEYAGVPCDVVADLRAGARREALLDIAELVSSSRGLPSLTAHVVHGHAATRVLDKARELASDLIVVSKSAKTRLEEWLVPGMTARLLEAADADVLVIPP